METVYEIIKITLPALLVMITTWLVIRSMLNDERDRRRNELLLQTVKTITPVRLQAYERVILFLERISPESLIMRSANPELNSRQLHALLITTIRNEFEHNLSQQIYISNEAWEMVRSARGTVVNLINNIASGLPAGATGEELSRTIIEEVMDMESEPCKLAIDFIKAELKRIMM